MSNIDGASTAGESDTQPASRERFQRLHRILRERICLLQYPPGRRLGEEELAHEFGTSRTPVQRVLARLEAEGLVERRQGVGTIVRDVDPSTLEQIYRLRLELASLMGRLAPMNCGKSGLDQLNQHLSRCDDPASLADPSEFARLNMDFNLKLFSMIGNVPLREITERLYFQTTRIWIISIPSMDDVTEEVRIFGRQVFDVIQALKIGDHGAVGDICRAHISMSFERIRRRKLPATGVPDSQ